MEKVVDCVSSTATLVPTAAPGEHSVYVLLSSFLEGITQQ